MNIKNQDGPTIIEGTLEATGLKFAIALARFNNFIVDRMLEGCLDTLSRHGCNINDSIIVKVPGSFELPNVVNKLARRQDIDAIIALGAVIRGATPHFDYISAEVTKGLAQISISGNMPVAYGIITANTIEQAIERAGTKAGNKGTDAALSAIEMANLNRKL
jgi:6,7-dimethyl-8-ribityllumazine synthase